MSQARTKRVLFQANRSVELLVIERHVLVYMGSFITRAMFVRSNLTHPRDEGILIPICKPTTVVVETSALLLFG